MIINRWLLAQPVKKKGVKLTNLEKKINKYRFKVLFGLLKFYILYYNIY